jgi:soluble lytic murein transglycosylase-like protein
MSLYSCVLFYSLMSGLNPNLTNAIIQVESRENPFSIGSNGDSGLMQIRHQFVPESQLQLLNSCTNIKRGVQLLKKAKQSCIHKANDTWVICYNLGIKGARRIKRPSSFIYYKKVMSAMRK